MEGTLALLLVVDVVALVLPAIGPLEHTLTFHFVVSPLASVLATVGPVVDTYKILIRVFITFAMMDCI